MTALAARAPRADGRRFRFDPLGADTQLFALPAHRDRARRTWPSRLTCRARSGDGGPPSTPPPCTAHDGADARGRSCSSARRPAPSPMAVPLGEVLIADLSDVPGGGGAWAHEPAAG